MPPRLNPQELAISERLSEFRKKLMISQVQFAKRIGVSRERLIALERGRARLRWGEALTMAQSFRLNLVWLASGDGPTEREFETTEPHGIKPETPFSEAFDSLRASARSDAESGMESAHSAVQFIMQGIAIIRGCMSPEDLARIAARVDELEATTKELFATVEAHQATDLADRENGGNGRIRSVLKKNQETPLTNPAIEDLHEGVKVETLASLLEEIRRLAKETGLQKDLAKEIGVSPKRLSEWLSGTRIPDAHNTLLLHGFVSRASLKNRPGRGISSAEAKPKTALE